MNKIFNLTTIAVAMIAVLGLVGCKPVGGIMTMTTSLDEVTFSLAGSETVKIDWGDGSIETKNFQNDGYISEIKFQHRYQDQKPRTIKITGKNILHLDCQHLQLTELDVSKNTRLEKLNCTSNLLTHLDLSQNQSLRDVRFGKNQFTTSGLNALFGTLHSMGFWSSDGPIEKIIEIGGNPGSTDCDPSIAAKGWTVEGFAPVIELPWENSGGLAAKVIGSKLIISGTGTMADFDPSNDAPWSKFRFSDKITEVIIEHGVTKIGASAFFQFYGLVSVTIPEGVTEIGNGAFYGCGRLSYVTIPKSVTKIGADVFSDCGRLGSINVPAGVTKIETAAFAGAGLLSIDVDPGNARFSSIDGVLFNKNQTVILQYPGGRQGDYAIPDGVREIGERAFSQTSVVSVFIPQSVMKIGRGAFYQSRALTTVNIPSGVKEIAANTFLSCNSLASIVIPSGVTLIAVSAFSDCSNLASVFIPNTVTRIADNAFWNCHSLTSVTIPESVTRLGFASFADIKGLTSVTILSSSPPARQNDTFRNLSESACLYVPQAAIDAYKASAIWKNFSCIEAVD
ncbi:MAG: leucine-rich repeat protein [Fibromonadaceae bacterium]|jgi:hypothetical protein|nr:leucine-rich repeat protein [Fibromonadaceae bacterium]